MRTSLVLVSVVATLLALASGGGLRADQLLTNGGFEDGISGWTVANGFLEPVAEPVAEGGSAALLTVEADRLAARAFQPVTLQPGGTYRLSGQALLQQAEGASFRIEVAWTETTGESHGGGIPAFRSMVGSYVTLSTLDVPIPCELAEAEVAVTLRRDSRNASPRAYIDDLRLETVEPPQQCPTPESPPTATAPPPATPPLPPQSTRGPEGDAMTPLFPGMDATPSPSLPPDALVNGGFELSEDGLPAGWRTYGGVLTRVSHPVYGGGYAGGFSSATDSTKWVYQTVPVTPTEWYDLTAHVYLDDPRVEAALLRISWYTSAGGTGRAVATVDSTALLEEPAGQYRRLTTGPAQAPAGVHSAKVRILLRPRSAAGAVIYIDDVSFSRTAASPDPPDGGGSGGSGATSSSGRSGSGISSEVEGFSVMQGGSLATPLPTPVVVRGSQLQVPVGSSSGGGIPWWPWALLGVLAPAGAAGWGVWRWRRRGRAG